MARRQQPNQSPEPIDWGQFMPQSATEQATDLVVAQHNQASPALSQQPLGITSEALAQLQFRDHQARQLATAQREALVRHHQEQLREAQQLGSRPMFGGPRGALPSYPRNDLQLPPGVAGRQPALPPGPHGRRPELSPSPGAPRALSRAPHEQAGPGYRKNPASQQPNTPGKKTVSPKEWFDGLSPARRVSVGLAAGVLIIGTVVGLGKVPDQAGSTTAQIARANQEYPVFKNDSFSCGTALAQVAFAGSMTLELKVNLKEPGHTAYLPVAAYMGTDLNVGVCGEPGKDGSAQPMALYTDKRYTADRSVLNLNAPGSSFAPQDCPPGSNEVKRICINTPKGFFVDGKKATIASTETAKGSGLYKVTTEDKKQFTVTAAELGRINTLTLAPTGSAAQSKEYTQYLTAIATNMKFAALKSLENPEHCAALQDTIDAAVTKAITDRNKAMDFKQPKNKTIFKKDSNYAPMSTGFMNDKANKAILEPENPANIMDVHNFSPTCSVKPIESNATASPPPLKTASK